MILNPQLLLHRSLTNLLSHQSQSVSFILIDNLKLQPKQKIIQTMPTVLENHQFKLLMKLNTKIHQLARFHKLKKFVSLSLKLLIIILLIIQKRPPQFMETARKKSRKQSYRLHTEKNLRLLVLNNL